MPIGRVCSSGCLDTTPGMTVVIQDGRIAAVARELPDANPLEDIRHISRIQAVLARRRVYPRAELDRILARRLS